MNIFRLYSKKIRDNITALDKDGVIKTPKDLNSISVDVPPENIQSDISTNAAMVLSKINSKSPLVVAEIIKKKLLEDNDISNIDILKPGFINIKFKSSFWNLFLENIINNPNPKCLLVLNKGKKISRNDLCEATGKKYKHCCGRL